MYYGPKFRCQNDPELSAGSVCFETMGDAHLAYYDFCYRASLYHQGVPADAPLFIGSPDGDEDRIGYPSSPDIIMYMEMNSETGEIGIYEQVLV